MKTLYGKGRNFNFITAAYGNHRRVSSRKETRSKLHFRKMALRAVCETDWGRGGKEQGPRQRHCRRQLQKFRWDKTADPISSTSQWEGSEGETILVPRGFTYMQCVDLVWILIQTNQLYRENLEDRVLGNIKALLLGVIMLQWWYKIACWSVHEWDVMMSGFALKYGRNNRWSKYGKKLIIIKSSWWKYRGSLHSLYNWKFSK